MLIKQLDYSPLIQFINSVSCHFSGRQLLLDENYEELFRHIDKIISIRIQFLSEIPKVHIIASSGKGFLPHCQVCIYTSFTRIYPYILSVKVQVNFTI